MEERLQKFLAECGVASRRKCEQLIKDGFISVNNIVVTNMGIKIDNEIDIVTYKGKVVSKAEQKVYIILNKPVGYVTTVKEQFNRKKVTDLLQGITQRIYPIGRLDYNTSGLLLLTNDGELAFRITHPGHEINKSYIAKVKGTPSEDKLNKLRDGIEIEGYKTWPAELKLLKVMDNMASVSITIHEGRNRQVRKMFHSISHDVIDLKRISIGKIEIGSLKIGAWRYLTDSEIDYLKSI